MTSYDDIAAPGWPGKARIDLWDRLHELLDDEAGHTPPELQGFLWDLVSMPEPARGLTWLRNNPTAARYLRGLAGGDIPLTHQALSGLPSWRTAGHLRDLLMAAGALPHADRQILLFDRWQRGQLAAVTDPGHVRLLRQFTTWRLLPRLHAKAARQPLTPGTRNGAAGQLTAARAFLASLGGRQAHATTQADIDTWHLTQRQPGRVHPFLGWAMRNKHMPRLNIPRAPSRPGSPISQHHRLTLLRRFLTDDQIALRTRVAGSLILLYAQPVSRLVRLTTADVTGEDSQVWLRLGHPPTPVPGPLDTMLRELAASRANMNTAANPDCDWLFPGGRAGQPLTAGALLQQLHALGVHATQTRTAAFRQLVLQAPAPVVAKALGYQHGTAAKHVAAGGGTWSRYPAARTGS